VSLARTARLLVDAGTSHVPASMSELNHGDIVQDIEQTDWVRLIA